MKSDIDITNKRFAILGLQGTGKSILVKHFLRSTSASIVYDVLREHQVDNFVNRVVMGTGQIRLFIMDEANRYCRSMKPLPASILDLNDFQRHENIAFGVIARRPTQLHTDLMELAHYLFIFRLVGVNDYKYLESIAEGLGDAARALEEFHFVLVNPDRSFQVHEPVEFKEVGKS